MSWKESWRPLKRKLKSLKTIMRHSRLQWRQKSLLVECSHCSTTPARHLSSARESELMARRAWERKSWWRAARKRCLYQQISSDLHPPAWYSTHPCHSQDFSHCTALHWTPIKYIVPPYPCCLWRDVGRVEGSRRVHCSRETRYQKWQREMMARLARPAWLCDLKRNILVQSRLQTTVWVEQN